MHTPDSLSERLSAYWADVTFDQIPDVEVQRIKHNILDTLAVALAGVGTQESASVRNALTDMQPSSAGSLVWGTSRRLTPSHAALANGTSAHARDFDDGGGAGHAGSTVLPAAIAVGEAAGADGKALICATIAGYDIGYRSLQALGGFAAHTDRGWHSSGTMGSIGAAAASAKMLGLDADRFADALGIAGSFTGGVWAFIEDGAWTKRIHPGKAGETGVDAAFLARGGITGPRRIFEAEWGGLLATYAGGAGSAQRALEGLGDDFNVASAYLKPYACCRGSHSSIDAMLDFIRDRDLRPEDVDHIIITAGETAINMLSVDPIESVFDAQFSLPYAISVALHTRGVGLDQFDPPRIAEPRIRDTFDRISMRLDTSIQLEDGPRLTVQLTDGSAVELLAGNPTTARGSAGRPLSREELEAKVRSVLGPQATAVADDLIDAVEDLENAPDLTRLLRALRAENGEPS